MSIKELAKGHRAFKENNFPLYADKFNDLVKNGQFPHTLFICCSDSRIIPSLILNIKPGDLFMVRNVGNFVPVYSENPGIHTSVASGIEFAVNVLGVSNIIICGHSNCGACATLNKPKVNNPDLINVYHWLEQTRKVKELSKLANEKEDPNNEKKIAENVEKISAVVQMENLLTYPYVKTKVEKSELSLHSWYYSIDKGSIEYYDREDNDFKNLDNLIE